jgi:hypothetical protein
MEHGNGSNCIQDALKPQVARLYGAAFMKPASVETAVGTFETLVFSHWIQTFFKLHVSAI